MSVSIDDLQKVMAEIGADTRTHIERKIREAIDPLQKRVADLEQRAPGVEYAGSFEQGKMYRRGQLVTKRHLWLALNDTPDTPGGSPHWKLIVRGEDR